MRTAEGRVEREDYILLTEFFHDPATNYLIYQGPGVDRILAAVPGSIALGYQLVAAKRTLFNCQMLRWLDYPVPPVMQHYDWPHGSHIEKPLAHQMVMANFMVLHPRSFNFTDMGGMKTLSACWAAEWLMKQYPAGECKALIVAPLSALQATWGDTIFANFAGRRTFEILHGKADKRLKLLEKYADFYVINPKGLITDVQVLRGKTKHKNRIVIDGFAAALRDRKDIKIVICDEATYLKDYSTLQSKVFEQILNDRPYVCLMTGTPIAGGPKDAYGLAKVINNAGGESFRSFFARTYIEVSERKFKPRKGAIEEAKRLLTPSIAFPIEKIWDGPPLTVQRREVALSAEQTQLLRDLKRDLQVTVKGGSVITPMNAAAVRAKAIQISLGAIYDADHIAHEVDVGPRLKVVEELIEETNRKILIFAPLTCVVNLLYDRLNKHWRFAKVIGATPKKAREEAFRKFQNTDDLDGIIADPGTMAHSINLYAGDMVIWYGPTEKPELYLQGNKRVHRPGQKFPVTVVQMVATAIERGIYKTLEGNVSMQDVLLDWIRRDVL